MNYIDEFKKALRLEVFLVALYDLLFVAATYGIVTLTSTILRTQIPSVTVGMPVVLEGLPDESVFLLKFWIAVIIATGITAALLAFFKGLGWLKIEKKKLSWTFIKKFIYTNLIWLYLLLILTLSISKFVQPDKVGPVIIIFALLAVHFSWILGMTFTRTGKPLQSITKALNVGVKKFYLLILPYILLIIVLALMSYLRYLPRFIGYIAVLIVFAFSKFYFAGVLEKEV